MRRFSTRIARLFHAHPKIASSDPIPEDEVKAFFSNYELLRDKHYFDARQTKNPKVEELAEEFAYWAQKGFLVHFIYISTGISTPKIQALVDKFSGDNQASNVEFEVWDIKELKDEYVSIKSIEEKYPEEWTITLAQGHYMLPDGELQNISFVVPGTVLQQLARDHKDSLFNWNIRRFLGRKGEVNAGLRQTLQDEPQHFFYYNNGISCLCETFSFEPRTRKLRVKKLQVVNGAQTVGAIKHADSHNVERALVLVKLTAVKHAHRETGLAASLIKTNNTQNTLRVPDFRSNDKIQIWLEQQFKNTKPNPWIRALPSIYNLEHFTLTAGYSVAEWLAYPLTGPPKFDILHPVPAFGERPNAIRSIEEARVRHAV